MTMTSPAPHLEALLQRDINLICDKLLQMAELDVSALNRALKAIIERDRPLAYSVILRDSEIDAAETELDQLCLEFIVRHQPVAANLRFIYAASKIVNELERVGDYAESVARQLILIDTEAFEFPPEELNQIANLSIVMLRDSVRAFVNKDVSLAMATLATEPRVNQARDKITAAVLRLREEQRLPLEALTPLVTVARRFERVSDQATNICEQAMYVVTGKDMRHSWQGGFNVLFIDEGNGCLSQMAEAIGRSLSTIAFSFASAGVTASRVNPVTRAFLIEKDLRVLSPMGHAVSNLSEFEKYHVVVALCPEAAKTLEPRPSGKLRLQWSIKDPSKLAGGPEQVRAAYEEAFQSLTDNIRDLVQAIEGDKEMGNGKATDAM
jgi:phosphate transport system protein